MAAGPEQVILHRQKAVDKELLEAFPFGVVKPFIEQYMIEVDFVIVLDTKVKFEKQLADHSISSPFAFVVSKHQQFFYSFVYYFIKCTSSHTVPILCTFLEVAGPIQIRRSLHCLN